jgi:hypothetical protein
MTSHDACRLIIQPSRDIPHEEQIAFKTKPSWLTVRPGMENTSVKQHRMLFSPEGDF